MATSAVAAIFNLVVNMVPSTPSIKVIACAETIPAVRVLPAATWIGGQRGGSDQSNRVRPLEAAWDEGPEVTARRPAWSPPRRVRRTLKLVASPGKPPLDRADRPAQAVGGFLVGQAFEITEDHDHPVVSLTGGQLPRGSGFAARGDRRRASRRGSATVSSPFGPFASLPTGQVGSGTEGHSPGHAIKPLGQPVAVSDEPQPS